MKKPVAKAAKAMMKAKPDVVVAIPAKGKGAAAKAKAKTPSKRGY